MNQNTKPPERPPVRNHLSVFGTPWPLDPPLLRIRLRYIAARFLQVPEPRISLRNTDEMLRWAQQITDDGMPRSAAELLRLAIEEDPTQRPLWQLLLARTLADENAAEFAELAKAFATQFPNDEAMAEINAIRQAISRDSATSMAAIAAATPTKWNSPSFFRQDASGQRALHESLLQAAT